MENNIILSIDQGTTSSRTLAFGCDNHIIATNQLEFNQFYPSDGWVEHDPEEIWHTTLKTLLQTIEDVSDTSHSNDHAKEHIKAVAITNQRETTIVWHKDNGEPIHNAIVWQDGRTAEYCQSLKDNHCETMVSEKTGLLLDPYFSASKIRWLFNNVPNARTMANQGKLLFGTVDSYLIWRLTEGKVHATDITNASRTLLCNIHSGRWDSDLLDLIEIPQSMLPQIRNSSDDFGVTSKAITGIEVPIAGVAGDQQAALVGQACFERGMTKSTYGTGCFMMMNTGTTPVQSTHKMLTTVAYGLSDTLAYALEGAIFNAGTAIQWLRDELQLIETVAEIEPLLEKMDAEQRGNSNVYLVPAFTGLGAPHWDPNARGIITGLTRDTHKAHFIRAAIESVCYQTNDLLQSMLADSQIELSKIRVDGGMAVNHWMLQFLSDVMDTDIEKPVITETTALGAANLAALHLGIYSSVEDISKNWQQELTFQPNMSDTQRKALLGGWETAIKKCLL